MGFTLLFRLSKYPKKTMCRNKFAEGSRHRREPFRAY
jgi:hypothetical protein